MKNTLVRMMNCLSKLIEWFNKLVEQDKKFNTLVERLYLIDATEEIPLIAKYSSKETAKAMRKSLSENRQKIDNTIFYSSVMNFIAIICFSVSLSVLIGFLMRYEESICTYVIIISISAAIGLSLVLIPYFQKIRIKRRIYKQISKHQTESSGN